MLEHVARLVLCRCSVRVRARVRVRVRFWGVLERDGSYRERQPLTFSD